jgi:uncharacterized repeat protein (TIGR01451 family)
MKLNLKNLKNLAQYAPHRVYAVILVALAVLIPSIAIFAYGPERPTFTAESPATYVTFNSITNSPSYGDERNFTLSKDATLTSAGGWQESTNVQDGKEYYVRVLVHNNAAANLNLVAHNTRIAVSIPTTLSTSTNVQATVSADNASPQSVWDGTILTSDKRFSVGYVPGSAHYFNDNNQTTGFPIPDSLFTTTGAQVGFNQMDGELPGCNAFAGALTFKVKVFAEQTPNFTVEKKVRKHGDTAWQKTLAATPGEQIDYQIGYANTGGTQQNSVIAKDALPAGVAYTNGTTTIKNANYPTGDGKSFEDGVASNGLNIGSYAPASNAYVRFTAKIADEKDLPTCGNNVLRNTASIYTDNGMKQDTADVTVTKTCEHQASYSCDALQATKISDLQYSFNVKLSSNMATAKEVAIDFGDGQNATRDVASLPVTHTYAAAGQYTVKANASFDVNGQTVKNITSDACQTVVNTAVTPPPAGAAPTTPTQLPSTGPVEVFAGILGASAFGLGIQQWIASRRAVAEAFSQK